MWYASEDVIPGNESLSNGFIDSIWEDPGLLFLVHLQFS